MVARARMGQPRFVCPAAATVVVVLVMLFGYAGAIPRQASAAPMARGDVSVTVKLAVRSVGPPLARAHHVTRQPWILRLLAALLPILAAVVFVVGGGLIIYFLFFHDE